MADLKCRNCEYPLNRKILDLGSAPPSNAFITSENLNSPEIYLPLRLQACENCFLIQTEYTAAADTIFNEKYAYFSSISEKWVEHAKKYSKYMVDRFHLNSESMVVEIASNDGYLLRNFVDMNIPCLGIEPSSNTASIAECFGVPVLRSFFSETVATELVANDVAADLIVGNNVYAHVPEIRDFTLGIAKLLKPSGVVTLEFPHLLKTIEYCQFDTVYHEHFSYLSALTVTKLFDQAGLKIFDIEELQTHGGSLRVFGCHKEASYAVTQNVNAVLDNEYKRGLHTTSFYDDFQERADTVKNEFLHFLISAKKNKKTVAAYGAAAKANTLLNYAGIKSDLLPFICDAAPSKQGKFSPGSQIPILKPAELKGRKIDYLIILPWNLFGEISEKLSDLVSPQTRLVTVLPELKII